jgi:hypothetical protein
MSSQIKVEPNVVPSVVKGVSYFSDVVVTHLQWTIKDFKRFLDLCQPIRSPSFGKVRPFHLEMEIPNKCPGTRCPVSLVQDERGQIEMKIALLSFGPKPILTMFGSPTASYVNVAETSFYNDGKKVMTITLPGNERYFPDEVTIELKVSQSQPAGAIVT